MIPRPIALALLLVHAASCSVLADSSPPAERAGPQVDTERTIALRAKLASSDAATRAWGAWEAGEAGARELVPDVVSALRRTLGARVDETTPFVLRAELDAFVRLEARLAAEDLVAASRVGSVRMQALVLGARDPKLHAAAIEAMRSDSRSDERIAIDNLLAAGAPARLATLLLPDAHVLIQVRVFDEGRGGGGGTFMRGIGCGSVKAPEGFPPTVLYELRRGAANDATVFADGPRPIAYRREVHAQRKFGLSRQTEPIDEAEHALRLLRWIANDREPRSFLAARVEVDHTWKDAQHYLDQVGAAVGTRKAAWRALVEQLVSAKLLEAKQVPEKDPISVVVDDRRANRSVALPPLAH